MNTPLIGASESGHTDVVKLLIKAKSTLDSVNKVIVCRLEFVFR
jgi:ankyrin repeat protein